MRRIFRMLMILTAAAVFSTRLPVNLVVVAIAALMMEDFELGDVIVIFFGALSLDLLNTFPLGFSVLPLALMSGLIHLLKSRIYVYSMLSRLLWLALTVFIFYLAVGALLAARSGNSLYIWNGILWGGLHAVAEGTLAAWLAPGLHRLLRLSWADLRSHRSIVVP